MTRPMTSIADQLNAAQLAIANSLADPAIQALVAGYGYTADKLQAGRDLLEAAMTAVAAQATAEGDQLAATHAMDAAERAAWDAYQALAKIARAVYKGDRASLTPLGLTGPMPKDTAGFLAAARQLFENAAGRPELSAYGYDAARLTAERSKVNTYEQANNRQETAKGTAQKATQDQTAALKKLTEWLSQYLKIARVAMRGDPQQLEKIGVAARTSPTAAQRAAARSSSGSSSSTS